MVSIGVSITGDTWNIYGQDSLITLLEDYYISHYFFQDGIIWHTWSYLGCCDICGTVTAAGQDQCGGWGHVFSNDSGVSQVLVYTG